MELGFVRVFVLSVFWPCHPECSVRAVLSVFTAAALNVLKSSLSAPFTSHHPSTRHQSPELYSDPSLPAFLIATELAWPCSTSFLVMQECPMSHLSRLIALCTQLALINKCFLSVSRGSRGTLCRSADTPSCLRLCQSPEGIFCDTTVSSKSMPRGTIRGFTRS